MIETAARKSCSDGAPSSARVVSTAREGYSVFTWLNLACLDAPIVAMVWMWFFARRFEIPIAQGGTTALFLTAWFIYLADRFADNRSLDPLAPTSSRQRFCRKHQIGWLVALLLVGMADVFVIFSELEARTRVLGALAGGLALAYLCVNQFASALWRRLPLKEICIGFLFAAGTIVPLMHSLTSAIVVPWLLFACLCALNCISIAVWERDLDFAQGRRSIATRFANAHRFLLPISLLLCLTSLALKMPQLASSVALLASVHLCRRRLQPDVRTALADLVLLTPVATLVF